MVQPQNLPSDVEEFISVMQLSGEQLVLLEQTDPGMKQGGGGMCSTSGHMMYHSKVT